MKAEGQNISFFFRHRQGKWVKQCYGHEIVLTGVKPRGIFLHEYSNN